jgi:TPP-dependent pyruvate/acetoin dehydrogenase alpha subunit
MNKEDLLEVYGNMFFLRTAEEKIAEYYFYNKIFSFVHFYIGQEAVAVGVSKHLKQEDRVFGNHRSHGHFLAKGGDLGSMYAEMLGKVSGCARGKGGSMHMLDKTIGFMGSTPILGSAVPIATGSAFQQKLMQESGITIVYLGDGAAEEGIFYESLNFAALHSLPIVIVLEDNLYSVNSDNSVRKSSNFNYGKIAEGFGIQYLRGDGNDIHDVLKVSEIAIESARTNSKPTLLHLVTFRHMAHSAPIRDDKSGYRVIDTEEKRVASDSLLNLRIEIVEKFEESVLTELEGNLRKKVEQALNFAIQSDPPNEYEMVHGVYA